MKIGVSTGSKSEGWANLRIGRPYIVFLIIWGSQGMLSSCIDFFGQWEAVDRLQQLTLWLAAAATLWALWRVYRPAAAAETGDRNGNGNGTGNEWSYQGGSWLLLSLMSAATVLVLLYVRPSGPLFIPLLKSFILAAGYSQLGIWIGRPLVWLGLWLFALTFVVTLFYLGYAPMVLGGFGGLSMLGLARILYIGAKKSEEEIG
jgi:hypothetical protein